MQNYVFFQITDVSDFAIVHDFLLHFWSFVIFGVFFVDFGRFLVSFRFLAISTVNCCLLRFVSFRVGAAPCSLPVLSAETAY